MFPRIVLIYPSASVPLVEDCPQGVESLCPQILEKALEQKAESCSGPLKWFAGGEGGGLCTKVVAEVRDGLEGCDTDTMVGCYGMLEVL